MQIRTTHLLLTLALALLPALTMSAGGTGKYQLPWPVRGEVLEYHACGCADACWVAEVRARHAKTVSARLRCDCENLYLTKGIGAKEQPLEQSCPGPDVDKQQFIIDLLQPKRTSP